MRFLAVIETSASRRLPITDLASEYTPIPDRAAIATKAAAWPPTHAHVQRETDRDTRHRLAVAAATLLTVVEAASFATASVKSFVQASFSFGDMLVLEMKG